MTTRRFCVGGGGDPPRDAEHAYHEVRELVGGCFTFVGTTFEGPQRVVISGADDLMDIPEQARLFTFPGQAGISGVMTVGEVLLVSAIDEVRGLAGAVPSSTTCSTPRTSSGRVARTGGWC